MATFDQRNQKVTNQYNAAGNINFGSVTSKDELVVELEKLKSELDNALESGEIEPEIGIDAKAKVEKAMVVAGKENPDKQKILDNIAGAKMLIEGLASAAGLVNIFVQASEVVRKIL